MRSSFDIVGKTEGGLLVVSGIFGLFDTQGIPLDVLLESCKTRGMIPCWTTFYRDALGSGWKHSTVLNRLVPVVNDIYGCEFSDAVVPVLSTFGVDDSKRKRQ